MYKKTVNDRNPNFRNEKGKLYLIRCFNCEDAGDIGRENYLPAVSSGCCVWCGWDDVVAQKQLEEEEQLEEEYYWSIAYSPPLSFSCSSTLPYKTEADCIEKENNKIVIGYKLVHGEFGLLHNLEKEVMEYVRKGWTPIGTPFECLGIYRQAMIKYKG